MKNLTLKNFEKIMNLPHSGWFPPGKKYSFAWGHASEGIYKEVPYKRSAVIFISPGNGGRNFLITLLGGELKITFAGDHMYDPQELVIDKKTLDEVDDYFGFLLANAEKTASSVSSPVPSAADIHSFSELLIAAAAPKFSTKEKESLFKEITALAEDPGSFFVSHEKEFAERGILEYSGSVFSILLMDRMVRGGIISELDWKVDLERAFPKTKEEVLLQWETDSDAHCVFYAKLSLADALIAQAKTIGVILKRLQ